MEHKNTIDRNPHSTNWFAALRQHLLSRQDSELEQAIIRVFAVFFLILYAYSVMPDQPNQTGMWRDIILLLSISTLFAVCILSAILINPKISVLLWVSRIYH